MYSRQDLYQKVHGLNIQIIKEWIKQAYFRTEFKEKENRLADELNTIEVILNEYLSLQDTLFSEAVILTEGGSEGTPRFFGDNFQIEFEDAESTLGPCFQIGNSIKKSLGKAMDIESAIVNQYKNFIEKSKPEGLTHQRLLIENQLLIEENESLSRKIQNQGNSSDENANILKEELEKQKKSYINLNNQHIKLQNDWQNMKNSYNELKNTHEELLFELRQDKEYTKLNQTIKNLSIEKDRLAVDYKESLKKNSYLEQNYVELSKKLEQELVKSIKLQKNQDNYLDDLQIKQNKIEKAQVFIKKLNEECERLSRELNKAEEQIDLFKKENRGSEKTWIDVKKKIQEYETMKKLEERLRDENYALKEKLAEVTEINYTEVNSLNNALETLIFEKKSLENDMEELGEKLNEIDVMNKERMNMYVNACEKINELEEIIRSKDQDIQKKEEEYRIKDENREFDMQQMKRHAENLIKSLQSNNSSASNRLALDDKTKKFQNSSINKENYVHTDPENPLKTQKTAVQHISSQLEETLKRESDLKSTINNLITQESNFLKERLKGNKEITLNMTREIER